jgi:O-antigen biosynthesis protein WbqP
MKRLFDCFLCFALAFVLAVPMLLIAILIKLTSKGPALYWSKRVGKDNELFKMPKFRSMQLDTPAVATHLLNDPDQYLTPIGKFLRRTSLDELPQLWSIIKGDMSFVGPRLTGWAQVNGRDELPIPQKVRLDEEYLQRKSFGFDLYVIWLTFLKVINGDGVSH